ncbi:MAG: S-layer homology domain-containing protein [Caldisericia bacterium]|nr:S-layer homology domain-containing protein [Caldisericia bacterium]
MKKVIAILVIFILMLAIGAKREEKIPEPYLSSINFLREMNVVSGYPDGTYRIDWAITQGEFITLLVRGYNVTQSYKREEETLVSKLKKFINAVLSIFKKKERFVNLKDHWVHPYLIELSRLETLSEEEIKPDTAVTIEEALFLEINLFPFKNEIKDITFQNATENKEKILSCSVSHNLLPDGVRFGKKLSRGDAFLLIERFIKKRQSQIEE